MSARQQPGIGPWDIIRAGRQYRAGGMGPKATLLVLLEMMGLHDGEWLCWPEMETIAWAVEANIGSVRRHIAAFEQSGLISRRPRGRTGEGGGGRVSNEFVLDVDMLFRGAHDARLLDDSNRASDDELPRNNEGVTAQSAESHCLIEQPKNNHKNDEGAALTLVDTPSIVDDLCELLADRVQQHRGGDGRPKITEKWRRDMRLLLERGPLHVDDAKPLDAARVGRAIGFVFEHLADPEGSNGFCWADQIRSAGALRDHWQQLLDAGRRTGIQAKGTNSRLIDAGRESDGPTIGELLDRAAAIDATAHETRAISAQ